MKKRIVAFSVCLILLFSLCVDVYAARVVVSSQNLSVDGVPVSCDKYNIDGSNYFKLRDLAMALKGTGSQFEVGYSDGVVTVTTGEEYTVLGTELRSGKDFSASAQPSKQTILIDGVLCSDLSVYNIGGNNFFKLRDLGQKVGFEVSFDSDTNTAVAQSRSGRTDTRQNMAMRQQWGNFCDGGNGVETADAVYYVMRQNVVDNSGKKSIRMLILRRTDGGLVEEVYTADRLRHVSVDDKGHLYFVENDSLLRCMDTVTGKVSTCLKVNGSIEFYLFYDDTLYYLEKVSTNGDIDSWPYRICACVDGKSKTLVSSNYKKLHSANEMMYAYNGKLYLPYYDQSGACLYACDLAAGKMECVLSGSEYSLNHIAMYDDTVWFLDSSWDRIMKTSVLEPTKVQVLATIPLGDNKLYPSLKANGNTVSYQVSTAKSLWSITPDGTVTRLATAPTPYYESRIITRQGVVLLPLSSMQFLKPEDIQVTTAAGVLTDYYEFLGF